MITFHIYPFFRRYSLLCIIAISFMQQSTAQVPGKNTVDLLTIAKPGRPEGWIDIRDQVSISPQKIFIDYKHAFGLGEDDEMRLKSQKTDKIGMTHYDYNQHYRNYRIDGSDVIVHERNGRVQSLNGNMVRGMNKPAGITVSENSALDIAMQSMGNVQFIWHDAEAEQQLRESDEDPNTTYFPTGELVWSRSDGEAAFTPEHFTLCWKFDIYLTNNTGDAKRIFVDAATGTIVRTVTLSFRCAGGTGTTAFYGTKDISTKNQDFSSDFELNDNCTNSHDYKIHTKDKNNGNGTTEYEDGDNSWTSVSDVDGVTTHYCLHRTLSYFEDVHGRNSYDDNGHNVDAFNNALGSFVTNACWNCNGKNLEFGEGPTTSSADDVNSMDVVGHEFTHAITSETAGLDNEKQSGALNESFSDIFGTIIENFTGDGTFDWTVGEDCGATFRSLINPNSLSNPDTYKGKFWITTISCNPTANNDQCGVHTNCGVQNFFFYLLCQGGSGSNDNGDSYSLTGIGIDDAADIAYRTLDLYITSSSKYADAREAWIRAANDLFGSCSDEALAVGNAWYAVGVGPDIDYYDLNVCGDIAPAVDTKYSAVNSVTAAVGCNTTIKGTNTHSVTFEAANSIVLDDGFVAEEGSTFYAIIDACNINNLAKTSTVASHDEYDDPSNFVEIMNDLKVEIAPSPFNRSFTVSITMIPKQTLQLDLYDITGKMLKTIVPKQIVQEGQISVNTDGSDLTGGIYIVKGFAGEDPICERVIKVK